MSAQEDLEQWEKNDGVLLPLWIRVDERRHWIGVLRQLSSWGLSGAVLR